MLKKATENIPAPKKILTVPLNGTFGREIVLQKTDAFVQWKYMDDPNWIDLIPLSDITGAPGYTPRKGIDYFDGVSGRTVEFQSTGTYIQWRYVGDVLWINIVLLADLKGTDGYTPRKGIDYIDGYTPVKGVDYFDGINGKPVEFQNNGTYLQWRYVGDTAWTNLITLASLQGADGHDIELQKGSTAIQWRQIGTLTWIDLVQLSDLKGAPGTTDYNNLSNKPTIPAAQVNSDWNASSGLAQILNKPTIPDISEKVDKVTGESLVADSLIVEIHALHSDDQDLSGLVVKVAGKGLSTEDFTTDDKNKLGGIASGAEVNVQADWNEADSSQDDFIKNKPVIPTVPTALSSFTDDSTHRLVTDSDKSNWNGKVDKVTGEGLSTNDYTTADKNKLAGIASGAEVNVQADWNAISGESFIHNKPTIPAAQIQSDWNAGSGMGQILNKPTIPTALSSLTDDATHRLVTDVEMSAWNGYVGGVDGGVANSIYGGQPIISGGNA